MTEIRPSDIHGLGLFAQSFIAEGQVIGKLKGEHVTDDGPHVLWLDEERGFRVENDLRFINHSDTPNAAYYDDLTVAALRDIHPGEEITHNYLGDEAAEDECMDFEPVTN
jgi:SET domain-containing protein